LKYDLKDVDKTGFRVGYKGWVLDDLSYSFFVGQQQRPVTFNGDRSGADLPKVYMG
jgi:hypothetical protein